MDWHPLGDHAHHATGDAAPRAAERRTRWVVIITLAMMAGELLVGWWSGSMALTADGWHMGTHAGALSLTAVAYWYARTRANHGAFAFGTGKVYALAGYTSGLLLGAVAVWMAVESVVRLAHPRTIAFSEAIWVATLGLFVNLGCALLLGHEHGEGHGHGHRHEEGHGHGHGDGEGHGHGHGHEHDHNLRAAYLHILADAVTSLLAVAALLSGRYLGWWFLDPAMGVVGGAVILWWAIGLCRQASHQLLDVITKPELEAWVRKQLEAIDDVRVADLHVWELGPGQHGCVVSLVTARPRDVDHYRSVLLTSPELAHLTVEIHGCDRAHSAPSLAS
ncbi:MAG: CDF family Co(II)/Ni(II) efflux transporter DmeF [Kofleriaceae bacterium]